MELGTGCFGFAAEGSLVAPRVIESLHVDPDAEHAGLWVDVFAENTGTDDAYLIMMHRGSLLAQTVTHRAWGPKSVCPVRLRVEELHKDIEKIERRDGAVFLDGVPFPIFERDDVGLDAEIGGIAERNVPFTSFRIGPFPPGERRIVRFKLEMTAETFRVQIGKDSPVEFYAYGEAILLDRIAEDLVVYADGDKAKYEEALERFMKGRLLPEVFEYMLISLDPKIQWRTTPLTYNFSPQILPADLDTKRYPTHWYIARFPHNDKFHLKMENAFVLKVEKSPQLEEEFASVA